MGPGTGWKGTPKRDQVRVLMETQSDVCFQEAAGDQGTAPTFHGVQGALQGGCSLWASGVSACLASRGLPVLYSGLSFPGCLYSGHPWESDSPPLEQRAVQFTTMKYLGS